MDVLPNVLSDVQKRVSSKYIQKSFNLLYSSVSNVNVDDFHVSCDNKGPTLTVLYGKYNNIYGGYTTQDWCKGKKMTKRDEQAFLFYTNDHAEAKCMFLPIKEKYIDRAITCDTNFGPTFGGGTMMWEAYDLQVFKSDKKHESEKKDGYIFLNGTMNFGCAYDFEDDQKSNDSRYRITSGHLIVKRIEVYQVIDDQLSKPWRKKPDDDELIKIKDDLEKMEPLPGLGIKTYNILLVGLIGSGKSSFYNTLASVFMGAVKSHAPARDAPKSVTNKIYAYKLNSKSGKTLNIRIHDIRGFEVDRGYEHELDLILNGRLAVGYSFPEKSEPVPQDLLQIASLKDEIHLVCLVIGTSNVDTITDDLRKRIDDIKQSINKKGLQMVAVATKLDEHCPRIAEDADHVYTSPKARDATKAVADFFGLREKLVFPIVNYVNDEETNNGKNRLALQALNTMVELIKDYLQNHKEMVSKPDQWSKRANNLHIPKHPNEKEIVLKNVGRELVKIQNNVIRVLCIGPAQSGKTSFIDSISSALVDKISTKATKGTTQAVPTSEDGPLVSTTKKFEMYQMKYKHESGDIIGSNVYFGDIPGFQETEGIQLKDVKNVILGHVPSKYKIIQSIQKDSNMFKHHPEKKDKVHCVCFVFDICTPADELSEKMQKTLSSLQAWLLCNDIPIIVILTKGDELSSEVKECKLHVFENQKIKENKDKLIDMFKFKQSRMFPVVNYIHEDQVLPVSDALLLSAFNEIVTLGKEYIEENDSEDTDDNDNEMSESDQ